jgi:ERF superfamily
VSVTPKFPDIPLDHPEQVLVVSPDPKPPSLREKLSRVAAHCAYVRKDGVNLFHKYNYATAATIFEKVNEALIENRLVSCPHFSIVESVDRTTQKGTDRLVTVKCELLLFDMDSDEDTARIFTEAFGSGQDHGDKAVMKAQTAAMKYAWMMLLNISTGDDPEDDATVDSRASGEPIQPRQTPEQREAKVTRNKTATLSPVAQALSKQLIKELAQEGVKPNWPGAPQDETPPVEAYSDIPEPTVVLDEDEERRRKFLKAVGGVEECECGSPIIEAHASKEKGGYAYKVCEASHKAFKAGKKLPGKHHWKRVSE